MQKETLLPNIPSRTTTITLAIDKKNRHQLFNISTEAAKTENGYLFNGKKIFVLDGHTFNYIIVASRTAGKINDQNSISLFLVDAKNKGVRIERRVMIDSRNTATVYFKDVAVDQDALIGTENKNSQIIEKVLDIARIGLSAEMLGTKQEAFDKTIAYLKEPQQFGVSIGSFQALQHRVVKMLNEIDQQSENLSMLASMTKAKVGETIKLVTNEGIQTIWRHRHDG